jgi:hypothetical protein
MRAILWFSAIWAACTPKEGEDSDSDTEDTDTEDTDTEDTDTSPVVVCDGGATRCADADTVEVCEADGLSWRAFDCDAACVGDDPASCAPMPLTGWDLHVFPTADTDPTQPSYSFSEDGTVAIQGTNALPSAYVNQRVVGNVRITGEVTVETTSDDDLIGLVFGWQDPSNFYLVDWKQATQPDTECETAEIGVSIKRFQSDAAIGDCPSFWSSAGSDAVTILSPASANPIGWADNQKYRFVVDFRPGDITVQILQGDVVLATATSADSTWSEGRFGFYNFSQQEVRYELVTFEPLP